MDEYKLMDLYRNFIRDYREEINDKLLDAFNHYYSHDYKNIMESGKFGAFVGIPLFVVWLIWGTAFETTVEQLPPALVLIVAGLCIHHYGSELVKDALHSSFRMHEYKDVLVWYVDQRRQMALSQVSDSERGRLNEMYNYFQEHIIFEDFRYCQKPKKRK